MLIANEKPYSKTKTEARLDLYQERKMIVKILINKIVRVWLSIATNRDEIGE
jgi:hypothetical protein